MVAERPVTATVVILTYNGETYIRQILDALRTQEFESGFETIIIDSGSTDGTLAIISEYPEVRLHTIPNTEFSHGRTRNLAATLARGEFIAYLTHDAVPASPRWLTHLLSPFALNDRVAAVLGRQEPRANAMPSIRHSVLATFAKMGSPESVTLTELLPGDDPALLGWKSFYSDVNSATRLSILRGPIPYRDIDYAEDQWFGRDVLDAGLIKAYAGRAVVEHSNDLTLSTLGPRIFDETVGLRRVGLIDGQIPLQMSIKVAVKSVIGECIGLLRDRHYSMGDRIKWMVLSPRIQFIKERYRRRALAVDLDYSGHHEHSLEGRLRTVEPAAEDDAT